MYRSRAYLLGLLVALALLLPSRALAVTYIGYPDDSATDAAIQYLGYSLDEFEPDTLSHLYNSTPTGGLGTDNAPNWAQFARFRATFTKTLDYWGSSADGALFVAMADSARTDLRDALKWQDSQDEPSGGGGGTGGEIGDAVEDDGYIVTNCITAYSGGSSTGIISYQGNQYSLDLYNYLNKRVPFPDNVVVKLRMPIVLYNNIVQQLGEGFTLLSSYYNNGRIFAINEYQVQNTIVRPLDSHGNVLGEFPSLTVTGPAQFYRSTTSMNYEWDSEKAIVTIQNTSCNMELRNSASYNMSGSGFYWFIGSISDTPTTPPVDDGTNVKPDMPDLTVPTPPLITTPTTQVTTPSEWDLSPIIQRLDVIIEWQEWTAQLITELGNNMQTLLEYVAGMVEWVGEQVAILDNHFLQHMGTIETWLQMIYNEIATLEFPDGTTPIDPIPDQWEPTIPEGSTPQMELGNEIDALKGKFPLSIPWDMYALIRLFDYPPAAPEWDIRFVVPIADIDVTYHCDLHFLDGPAVICRHVSVIWVVIVLMTQTRKIIEQARLVA